ncbi:unnamed protein product [Echinostoma caproni]|uniref:Uncharacterized protein n=1 Tax=Echinostoma caproni TaxID=27848 RepID=A0A183AJM9_9TREM|nr:unnamed protein product [Echinostoma caproni]
MFIYAQGGLFFSSTSESLDSTSTFPTPAAPGKTGNEPLTVKKPSSTINNTSDGSSEKDSEDNSRRQDDEAEQQQATECPNNRVMSRRAPNISQLPPSNSAASLSLSYSSSPPISFPDSLSTPKSCYIYRILFNSVPNTLAQNTAQPETGNQRKHRVA